MKDVIEIISQAIDNITKIAQDSDCNQIVENNCGRILELALSIEKIEKLEKRVKVLKLLEQAECNNKHNAIQYCTEFLEELKNRT